MTDQPTTAACVRQPCRSCPWRRDQDAQDIPNFRLDLAEALAATSPDDRGFGPDFGSAQFACHQSREGAEVVCAGWLAQVGSAHPAVRIQVMTGRLDPAALEPRPELHDTFGEVIEKLRATA